jgi:hypothetical protein
MSDFLLTSLALFLVWLGFLLFGHQTRREQMIMSLVGLVLSPAILLVVAVDFRSVITYGALSIGIEDLIFTMSLFGIAAVIYHILLGKHVHKMRGDRVRIGHPVAHWFAHLLILLGIWAVISLLLIDVFDVSSIRAIIVGGLLLGTYMIADRKDLLLNALVSGLMTAVLVFIVEQIFFVRLFPDAVAGFWQYTTTRAFVIGNIPLEEILWAAVVGFTIGPLYEYVRHLKE